MPQEIVLGAVAYAPKVITIWDGFKAHFEAHGIPFDYILYSNYERQVEAHFHGQYDIAWNSPLAWIQSCRIGAERGRKVEAVAMRDTDCDLHSVVVVRSDSPLQNVGDLKQKSVGVGAKDSPQATLIPLVELAEAGMELKELEIVYHDRLVGKHGDHVGGEGLAAQALAQGEVDAACMIEGNYQAFCKDGTLDPQQTRVLHRSAPFDHCNFTVLEGYPQAEVQRFVQCLYEMSFDDPEVRPLLEMEGLQKWVPGRDSGYETLRRAVDRFHYLDEWLAQVRSRLSS